MACLTGYAGRRHRHGGEAARPQAAPGCARSPTELLSTPLESRPDLGPGPIEVAFAQADGKEWVLMRLTGDPDGRVSVFSRFERDCFLGGVRNGEFDDAASSTR